MLRDALRKAAAEGLTEGEAEQALGTIMEESVPPAATAALLTALRVRGKSVSEIVGFARTMRRFAAGWRRPRMSLTPAARVVTRRVLSTSPRPPLSWRVERA